MDPPTMKDGPFTETDITTLSTMLYQECRVGNKAKVAQLLQNPSVASVKRQLLNTKHPVEDYRPYRNRWLNLKMFYNKPSHIEDNPLHCASFQGNKEIVDLLLGHGADPNIKNDNFDTPLHLAYQKGCIGIAKRLILHGAIVNSVNKYLNTPLHEAVYEGHQEFVELLLKHGAKVNLHGGSKQTALHIAIMKEHYVIIELLLRYGADLNAFCTMDDSPLHCLRSKNCEKVLDLLLKYGADINIKNRYLVTPLHQASLFGHRDIVLVLLKRGVNINVRDMELETPLHEASFAGHPDIILLLLKRRADINAENSNSETPLFCLLMDNEETLDQPNIRVYPPASYALQLQSQLILEIFMKHVAKMKEAGLYVSDKNLSFISDSPRRRKYYEQCQKELRDLRNENVTGKVTLHDVITKGVNQLCLHARDDRVAGITTNDRYSDKFPIFASDLKDRISEAIQRRNVMDEAEVALAHFFQSLGITSVIVQSIFFYLEFEDIKGLITAFEKRTV